ncbi:hypothetical protein EAX61_09260 [Dokdonia sinensis]|uniref:Uncharacterized protein n=1 Tax=Dokdonia sinensis TaxID=2479847 RepID=A0A3M0GMG8_9FLAO|nr:hypothetical protein [Dokdonia sinensis]RMB58486.1 hypothetical protein EAX61_09260 [Dokdonia sinensis]
MPTIKFKIGDIVTLKSHPMAFQPKGEIDSFVSHIPPLMCIKEIHIERKKEMYSKEMEGSQIADNVKYLCTYFNQHRLIFEDKYVYQELLLSFEELLFHKAKDNGSELHQKLIDETLDYNICNYQYGKRIFFKTYKLEKRKTFKSAGISAVSSNKSLMTHTSPAFLLSGFMRNDKGNQYDGKSGKLIRQCSKDLYKVIWYNSYQEKYSEEFMPSEFFTDDSRIYRSLVSSPPVDN